MGLAEQQIVISIFLQSGGLSNLHSASTREGNLHTKRLYYSFHSSEAVNQLYLKCFILDDLKCFILDAQLLMSRDSGDPYNMTHL